MPCILPENIKDLRQAITQKGGFGGLRRMTADERINLFKQFVDNQGEQTTAEWLNRQIEQRIFVKNDTQAARDWLRNLQQKKVKISNTDALLDRIINKKEIFNPKQNRFAEGLAKQALGFSISQEDIKSLYDTANTINQLKKKLLATEPNYLNMTTEKARNLEGPTAEIRKELGKKLVDFQRQYEAINLKAKAKELEQKGIGGKLANIILQVAGNIKSMKASFDVSFLRQIQNALYVDPKGFKQAWMAGQKVFWGKKDAADAMLGELLTRPNALANRYNDFGIEVGIKEEAFPESWISQVIDKIPGIEQINAFKRSEDAFNVAVQSARANLFDYMWEKSNGDIKLLKQQNVGEAIGIITGRGTLPLLTGTGKSQRIINNMMFAPKWLSSRIQTLLDTRFVIEAFGKTTPKAIRGRAAIGNALMIALTTALAVAWWNKDDEDERNIKQILDPRSSDFGKLTIGRTRFDVSTGTAGLITLAARLSTSETVNAKGVKTVKTKDVFIRWLSGKQSPAMSTMLNIHELMTKGKITDYSGYRTVYDPKKDGYEELASVAMEQITPITLGSGIEAASDIIAGGTTSTEAWAEIFGVLADFIGIGANTYGR